MRLRFLIGAGALALTACAAVTLADGGGRAWADDFLLIRNAKNPTAVLTNAVVKDMAIGKRKVWPTGAPVGLVLNAPGTPELRWFAARVCGASDGDLLARIKQEVYKGELRKPVIAASEAEVITAVAAQEGALGTVRASAAKSLPPTVAILAMK